MACVPASCLTGLIGCFVDRPRWLAIVMTVITALLLILLFAPLLASIVC
jgi:hypothetical protein